MTNQTPTNINQQLYESSSQAMMVIYNEKIISKSNRAAQILVGYNKNEQKNPCERFFRAKNGRNTEVNGLKSNISKQYVKRMREPLISKVK